MSTTNVLIVDDDQTFSESFKRLLETSYGIEDVQVCSSEKQALAAVERSFDGFTHIFVDCVIPGSDGVGLSEALHKLNTSKASNAKTFLLSGFIDVSMLPDDLSYISGTFKKPIEKEDLTKHFEEKSVIQKFDFFSKFSNVDELIANCTDKTYENSEEFIPALSQLMQFEYDGKVVIMTKKTDSSVIFMSGGEFNHITDSTTEEPLGEQLVKNGYLLKEHLDQVLTSDLFKDNSLKIGNFLIEKNMLSPHAVDELIHIQIQNRFKKILNYENFKVSFIREEIEKKNATLSFTDYFNCLKENLNVEKSLVYSLSKKVLESVEELYPTSYFAMLKNSQDISVNTQDTKVRFLLVLSGAATLKENEAQSNMVTKSDLKFAQRILEIDNPYAVLGVDPEKASDSLIAKTYHKIAKKIHPDRLETLNLTQEEEEIVQKGFAKLTSDFNKIKTADKRKNLEARSLLEKEKNKNKLNQLISNVTELLHKAQYLEAKKIINIIHTNHPESTHDELPIVSLWVELKTKNKEDIDINKARATLENHTGAEKNSLEHYLLALLCKVAGDSEGFIKNLQVSTQIDSSFLPARREFVQFKSEVKKAQEAKKSSSAFGSFFSSKKSS